MSILGADIGMGHWADVIAPTGPSPTDPVAPGLPGPTPPRPTTGIPPMPPVSGITVHVPAECAEIKSLVYGRMYSADFVIPEPIPRGTVVVVAARLPRELRMPADQSWIDEILRETLWHLARISIPGWGGSGQGYILGNWSYVLPDGTLANPNRALGYVPRMQFMPVVDGNVIYLAFQCQGDSCSRLAINAAATKLQTEIRRVTGTAVLAMSAKASGTRWGNVVTAVYAAIGGLEDLGAAIASVFSTSIAWDYRRSFLPFENQDTIMSRAIHIASNPGSVASAHLVRAREIFAGRLLVSTADPASANTAYLRLDEQLAGVESAILSDVAALGAGQRTAASTPSAGLVAELTRLPASVRSYVQTKIASTRSTVRGEDRQRWLACRWWTEAESQYPEIEANLTSRITRTRSLEAWFAIPSNIALFGPATAALLAARAEIAPMRREIARLRSLLNLAWYEKKIGPLSPIGWGITAIGAGLAMKFWKMRRAVG